MTFPLSRISVNLMTTNLARKDLVTIISSAINSYSSLFSTKHRFTSFPEYLIIYAVAFHVAGLA
jgi:hypothetical protein